MKINYDIIKEFSNDTTTSTGQSIGFYGIDDWKGFQYNPAVTASTIGLGECNNSLINNFTGVGGFRATGGYNQARLKRMENTSFDPLAATNIQAFFTGVTPYANATGKHYVSNSTSTALSPANPITYNILATIPLNIIHDLFNNNLPLTKGLFMRLTLTLNTHNSVYTTTTLAPAFQTSYTVTNSSNGCIPYQISQIGAGGISMPAAVTKLTASLGIAKSYGMTTSVTHPILQQCRLYVPAYKLSAKCEELYIKQKPQKTFYYKDFHSFPNCALTVTPGSTVTPSLNISLPRLRGLLIIPQMAAAVHGAAVGLLNTTGGGTLGSPIFSPFSSSPSTCAPFSRVTNFVFLGGSPIYSQNISYGYEQFFNEVRKDKGAYGNMLKSISSGLIGQNDWENAYNFIYCNLERCQNDAVDNVQKVVSFQLTNSSTYTCDYYAFLIYEKSATISTTTGQLIVV
jgi:hypothetical protein